MNGAGFVQFEVAGFGIQSVGIRCLQRVHGSVEPERIVKDAALHQHHHLLPSLALADRAGFGVETVRATIEATLAYHPHWGVEIMSEAALSWRRFGLGGQDFGLGGQDRVLSLRIGGILHFIDRIDQRGKAAVDLGQRRAGVFHQSGVLLRH
jgi:hypothetical protein